MGDRARVVFHDERKFSPSIYLHWGGGNVRAYLNKALPRMRTGDLAYASARFCGTCHEEISGGLSLGLLPAPDGATFEEQMASARSSDFSHGDAGVFLVNVQDWTVEAINGYGFGRGGDDDEEEGTTIQLDASRAC